MANPSNFGSSTPRKEEPRQGSGQQHGQEHSAATMTEKAKDTLSAAATKAKDAASSVAGSAQDLSRKAGDAASNVGHMAEDAVSGVGQQMQTLAGTIREKAPREGVFGSTASSVASSLEAGGRYLQEENLSGMADDLTSLIRRYPMQALLVGLGVGFLVARATRS